MTTTINQSADVKGAHTGQERQIRRGVLVYHGLMPLRDYRLHAFTQSGACLMQRHGSVNLAICRKTYLKEVQDISFVFHPSIASVHRVYYGALHGLVIYDFLQLNLDDMLSLPLNDVEIVSTLSQVCSLF